ncbi:MAG: J domain-containing protein [Xanthobacteraceae bacterium]|nr:J domain-containing protein [Xanthobacteraceae bacterium]
MRDPYEVLGVDRKASAGDIKSAFRRLAKKLHPDANKNDPKAASRFAEINAAYEILGEDDKRKAFDRGEIDAEGKPRFRGYEGFGGAGGPGARAGGFAPESEFETFSFGPEGFTRGTRRGRAGGGFGGFEDILREAFGGAAGARRGGAAYEPDEFNTGTNVTASLTVSLQDAAHGATQRLRLPSGKDVEVKIPAGIGNGQQIRLRGQGMTGPGGAGDLLITVSIAPHPTFTLEGADIRLDLPVTLYEAVLGAKVRVPTLDRPVEIAIPAGTSSGRTFRLKGKGFPAKAGRGDLLATVRIMLPEKSDPELEELMKKWRTEKPYDPRKDL